MSQKYRAVLDDIESTPINMEELKPYLWGWRKPFTSHPHETDKPTMELNIPAPLDSVSGSEPGPSSGPLRQADKRQEAVSRTIHDMKQSLTSAYLEKLTLDEMRRMSQCEVSTEDEPIISADVTMDSHGMNMQVIVWFDPYSIWMADLGALFSVLSD
jgi:hypothetical protein